MGHYWTELVRAYLVTTMKLCRLNPAGELDGFGPPTRPARALPVWSHLAELFYWYFTLKLTLITIIHHQYSSLRQDWPEASSVEIANETLELERHLESTERLAGWLRILGDTFRELEFAIVPTYLMILSINFLGRLQPRLFMGLHRPARLNVLALLLDPERERAVITNQAVASQVGDFLASIRNSRGPTRELVADSEEQVRSLELAGQLVASNRRPEWRHQMALLLGVSVLFLECSGLIMTLFFTLLLFHRTAPSDSSSGPTGRPSAHSPPGDLLFLVELILYSLLSIQTYCLLMVAIMTNVYDQMDLVRELKQLTSGLIGDVGRLRASWWVTTEQAGSSACRQQINRELIRTLLLYKQFIAQLRSSRRLVGFLGATMILIAILVPTIDRLYAAHMTRNIRLVSLARDLFVILCADALILPQCWLYARCVDLFRSMSSLLAQVAAQQAQEQDRSGRQGELFDRHTVWLLRREQNAPELALRRFAANATFMSLTYANLLGIHFWCGLLLAPLVLRDTSHLGSLGGNPLTGTSRFF